MNVERNEGVRLRMRDPTLRRYPACSWVSEAQERGWAGELEREQSKGKREQSKGSRMGFPHPREEARPEEASRETGNILQGVRTGRA